MFAFGQSLFRQVLKTLGAPGLCVVLCFALVTGGVVTVAIVNQTIGCKPVVEWVTRAGVVRVTFPTADPK